MISLKAVAGLRQGGEVLKHEAGEGNEVHAYAPGRECRFQPGVAFAPVAMCTLFCTS